MDIQQKLRENTFVLTIAILISMTLSESVAAPELPADTAPLVEKIRSNDKALSDVLNSTKSCRHNFSKTSAKLCSGVEFLENEVLRIKKLGISGCKSEIENSGYRILTEYDSKVISRESWGEFSNSTKRAETLHAEKLVLFRSTSTVIDCVHELTHVRQRTANALTSIAPLKRQEIINSANQDLEPLVAIIEKEEKNGTIFGRDMEAELLKHIAKIKLAVELTQSFDEVEAHQLVYWGCRNWWRCSEDDLETAIANLYRRSSYLEPKFAEEIKAALNVGLDKKNEKVMEALLKKWKCLTKPQRSAIKKIKNPEARIEILQAANNPWIADQEKAALHIEKDFSSGRVTKDTYEFTTLSASLLPIIRRAELCMLSRLSCAHDKGAKLSTRARQQLGKCGY